MSVVTRTAPYAPLRWSLTEDLFLTPLGPFECESGEELANIGLAWESWGTLSAGRDNAVLVLHGLTGDCRAKGTGGAPGWWEPLIGPGRAIDTDRFFVIAVNVLGGCSGSTGPASVNPSNGRPYGPDFPHITIRDTVRAERRLLDRLEIRRLAGVVGGSLGGARALEWALTYPEFVDSCAVIASTAASSAEQIALGHMQLEAIRLDPAFRSGRYDPAAPPAAGLGLARQLAHLSYRSPAELEFRFSRRQERASSGVGLCTTEDFSTEQHRTGPSGSGQYSVASYLGHQGRKLVARFDANSYVRLTEALMGHDVGRGRGGVEAALRAARPRFLVASVSSDRLYLPSESEQMARALGVEHVSIDADNGHDAFLTHAEQLSGPLARLLGAHRTAS